MSETQASAKMTDKTKAILLLAASSVLACLLGASIGAEYVMRQWDAMDARAVVERAADEKKQADTLKMAQQSAEIFAQANAACRGQFAEATMIYEHAPRPGLGLSIGGLQIQPAIGTQADFAPHWWIPAKIVPQVIGDARGALYYYVGSDRRMDGPYMPEQARQ